ncbi:MAG: hypothetical protein SVX38_12755 [Chloroflexota bacterium]|nr:hypothetical protein [Chloroflexota bacterium]
MNTQSSLLRLITVGLVFALGTACANTPSQTSAPTPTPSPPPALTATPTLTPTTAPTATSAPTATPPVILFQDDFSDPDSGWERYREWDGVLDYEDGGYRMWINAPSNLFWVNRNLDLVDVCVAVEATKKDGPDANQFGVMCRLDRTTFNYYAFLIGSDGRYGIGKVIGGTPELIGVGDWQYSDAINQGSGTNHIRAACVGDTLTLFVNGQQLLEVQDGDLLSGDVGLLAGTFDEAGTDILFDDFTLSEP